MVACTNSELPDPFEKKAQALEWSKCEHGGEVLDRLRWTGVRAYAAPGLYETWERSKVAHFHPPLPKDELWFGVRACAGAGVYNEWEEAMVACTNEWEELPEPFEKKAQALEWSKCEHGGEVLDWLRRTGFRACAVPGLYETWERSMVASTHVAWERSTIGEVPKSFAEYAASLPWLRLRHDSEEAVSVTCFFKPVYPQITLIPYTPSLPPSHLYHANPQHIPCHMKVLIL